MKVVSGSTRSYVALDCPVRSMAYPSMTALPSSAGAVQDRVIVLFVWLTAAVRFVGAPGTVIGTTTSRWNDTVAER